MVCVCLLYEKLKEQEPAAIVASRGRHKEYPEHVDVD